ncbi:methyltransferase [Kingella kingae]|uniref:methyltransferase family protein n=2 Tax=Kingella kingae TaxID=504 RepID=UPI0004007818|nr:methyltransferase [Kingella kingae]MDK4555757.1 methyltransferase [Kingella kingae]MDK4584854.1 methyltransferase [Kingella kingae]MDK4588867.1 methyltransferase [Kingella kingae]MDK4597077.1 methyltransferase [Kingella kingae]MDK4601032.1 methyltransferase [Kingella kingae]
MNISSKFSVHNSAWAASFVLLISFLLGWANAKWLSGWIDNQDYIIRIWFLICLVPLVGIAFRQNQAKLSPTLNAFNKQRIIGKMKAFVLQLVCVVCMAFLAMQVASEYAATFMTFVGDMIFIIPVIILLSPFYITFVDRRLANPEDEYAKIGTMFVDKNKIDVEIIKSFMLKTLVKSIFIPYMYGGFIGNLALLLSTPVAANPVTLSLLLFNIGISIDMLVGVFGYLVTSSLINNQVKDTDRNFLGWAFALVCYPPLFDLLHNLHQQTDNLIWSDILPSNSIVYWIMFGAINVLWIIYWLATIEFGMGFSNLSWRKLVNTGVYRYTKHPAYVAKNLYWWLHTLPFCGVAWFSANWWHNMLALFGTSLVYYGRACSEERHLMKFPEYRAYAEHISKHGLFRKLKLPFIK